MAGSGVVGTASLTVEHALLFRAGLRAALEALPSALLLAGALLSLSRAAGAFAIVGVFLGTLRVRAQVEAVARAFPSAAPMAQGALLGGAGLLVAALGLAAMVHLLLRGPLRSGSGIALCAIGAVGLLAAFLPGAPG